MTGFGTDNFCFTRETYSPAVYRGRGHIDHPALPLLFDIFTPSLPSYGA